MSLLLALGACHLVACSRALEDSIESLQAGGDEGAAAAQELLLANERSISPLVSALERAQAAAARVRLIEVLTSLTMRVADGRIHEALSRQLRHDTSPEVRAFIAQRFGLYRTVAGIPALLHALRDSSGDVRFESLQALGMMADKLDDAQLAALEDEAHGMLDDPHEGARFEAKIRVEFRVDRWVKEAQQLALRSELAEAESLYQKALTFAPGSKRGSYRSARYYMDNGQPERGMALLRQNGMLLDVPRLATAPSIDGELGEEEWQGAARIDSFLVLATLHYATFPSSHPTRLHVGYTTDALYIGFYGYDAHPDSLIVRRHTYDEWGWGEDLLELCAVEPSPSAPDRPQSRRAPLRPLRGLEARAVSIDASFDHRTYGQVGINSLGVVTDHGHLDGEWTLDWNLRHEAAAHVGADYWSCEYRLPFDQRALGLPERGTLWGFNAARVYRDSEYAQWVRTFFDAHSPNDFGILRFD